MSFLRGGRCRTQGFIDQIDVALILFLGHSIPHFGSVDEIGLGLLEKHRHLLQTADDVSEALIQRCVVQHVAFEQRVARELNVNRRIVFEALYRIQIEQSQPDIILHDLGVGGLFLVERFRIEQSYAGSHLRIEVSRSLNAGGAIVVQQAVERNAFMRVVPRLSSTGGRQRKAAVDEIRCQLIEIRRYFA